MTSEERLELIKNLAKAGKKPAKKAVKTSRKRGRPAKTKVDSDFVPLAPMAPSQHDIEDEYDLITKNTLATFN